MKKVLIVLYNLSQTSGVAKCIMPYYDSLINNGYKIDFLLLSNNLGSYVDIIQDESSIKILPQDCSKYSLKTRRYISGLMQSEHYSIVHVNIPGPFGVMVLSIAKKDGAFPIYHSHNPKSKESFKAYLSTLICDPLCTNIAELRLACSQETGISTFGKRNFTKLRNCIDVSRFSFDFSARSEIRNELCINEDTLLIGTVGRIEKQKNPIFTLQCINELRRIRQDFHYVWIGRGSMLEEVHRYLTDNNMEKYVSFVGPRTDVYKWYSAMDCFLLPSNYEGLGIVFIEAQAAGLTCFGSSNVSVETEITELMNRLDLKLGSSKWAEIISNINTHYDRSAYNKQVVMSGYNIANEKEALLNLYNGILKL